MTDFQVPVDEWYRLRDDRTLRVTGVSGYEDFTLGIIVSDDVVDSFSTQVMTLLSVNIAARWCRNIRVEVNPARTKIYGYENQDFNRLLLSTALNADPYCNFKISRINESCSYVLGIGCLDSFHGFENYSGINGQRWLAGIGKNSMNHRLVEIGDNLVGPAFASCLGAAEVFRFANGHEPMIKDEVWYSLYDFSKSYDFSELENPANQYEFDYGNILQIGCGAVGSCLDYLFSLTSWKADVSLIDFDQVEFSNCNRSLGFSAFDAQNKSNKVDACERILMNSLMTVQKFNGRYSEYLEQGRYHKNPPDVILSLANEENVWLDIQNNLPPLVLHGTTTPNWGVNMGRHIPLKEWCIVCRFWSDIDQEFTPECGEVEVRDDPSKPVLGVLPFLSITSAIFIFSEMAKMFSPSYPVNDNYVEFSMKKNNTEIMSLFKKSKQCEVCRYQKKDWYPEYTKKSKFWKLSH